MCNLNYMYYIIVLVPWQLFSSTNCCFENKPQCAYDKGSSSQWGDVFITLTFKAQYEGKKKLCAFLVISLVFCRSHGWFKKPSLCHCRLSLPCLPRRLHACLTAGQSQQDTRLSNAQESPQQCHWATLPLSHRAGRTAPHTLSQCLQLCTQNPMSGKGSSIQLLIDYMLYVSMHQMCNLYREESTKIYT